MEKSLLVFASCFDFGLKIIIRKDKSKARQIEGKRDMKNSIAGLKDPTTHCIIPEERTLPSGEQTGQVQNLMWGRGRTRHCMSELNTGYSVCMAYTVFRATRILVITWFLADTG